MAEMVSVRSSNIASVGWDEDAGEMLVEFHSGATYAYAGVDQSVMQDMIASTSPGQYFLRNIRDIYAGRKL